MVNAARMLKAATTKNEAQNGKRGPFLGPTGGVNQGVLFPRVSGF